MEQFLENTHRELKIYLKENYPKTSEEMAKFANRWTEKREEIEGIEIIQYKEYSENRHYNLL